MAVLTLGSAFMNTVRAASSPVIPAMGRARPAPVIPAMGRARPAPVIPAMGRARVSPIVSDTMSLARAPLSLPASPVLSVGVGGPARAPEGSASFASSAAVLPSASPTPAPAALASSGGARFGGGGGSGGDGGGEMAPPAPPTPAAPYEPPSPFNDVHSHLWWPSLAAGAGVLVLVGVGVAKWKGWF